MGGLYPHFFEPAEAFFERFAAPPDALAAPLIASDPEDALRLYLSLLLLPEAAAAVAAAGAAAAAAGAVATAAELRRSCAFDARDERDAAAEDAATARMLASIAHSSSTAIASASATAFAGRSSSYSSPSSTSSPSAPSATMAAKLGHRGTSNGVGAARRFMRYTMRSMITASARGPVIRERDGVTTSPAWLNSPSTADVLPIPPRTGVIFTMSGTDGPIARYHAETTTLFVFTRLRWATNSVACQQCSA